MFVNMESCEVSQGSSGGAVCLVVIYNHNYEQNIEKINRLYRGKFSEVYHLMPFYQGSDPRVISVYDSSHQFNNYITQARHRLSEKRFGHYVFVADDMIIRQDLNEGNIIRELGLSSGSGYIPFLKVINNESFFAWPWALKQVGKLNFPTGACEFRKFMPDLESARKHLERHGLDWRAGYTRSVLKYSMRGCVSPCIRQLFLSYFSSLCLYLRFRLSKLFRLLVGGGLDWDKFVAANASRISRKKEIPEYPLLWAYADMFVLPGERLQDFCHMSGVLAAGRVMVEAAIPTAMAFTLDHIVQADPGESFDGRHEGSADEIFERNEGSLASLIKNWKKGVLFYHPVKLSRWKLDI
jgi:hypothetical protein